MMRPQEVVEHMMNRTVTANDIMSADLRPRKRKGPQRLIAAVLSRMVNDDEVGPAQSEIRGAHPGRGIIKTRRVGNRILPQELGVFLCLSLVILIGGRIRVA